MPIEYVLMSNFSDDVSVSVCLSFTSGILGLNAFGPVLTRLSSTACMQRLLNSFTGSFSQTIHPTFCKSFPISCLAWNETFFSLPLLQTRNQKMCHSHLFVSQKDVGTFSLWCFALKHCRLEKSLIISNIVIGGLALLSSIKVG